jgi:Na+-driven multidrug efflux pump
LADILPSVWSVIIDGYPCQSNALFFANHELSLAFFPVTATFVSTENAIGNQEGVQDAICQAMFVGMLFALVGGVALLLQPDQVLSSVLKRKKSCHAF